MQHIVVLFEIAYTNTSDRKTDGAEDFQSGFMDELLVRLKIENNMDFCGDLANIQSIFNYANEYIRPLNKIQFRGGK